MKTIKDIQDRKDLTLVTTDYEVQAIKDNLNLTPGEWDCIGGFFVNVGEGEYTEVYGFDGSVPHLWKELYTFEIP